MAKPKVGDKAIIDGAPLTIVAVEPNKKPVVVAGCADYAGRDGKVAAIRKKFAPKLEAVNKKLERAIEDQPEKNARRQITTPLLAELAGLNHELGVELESVPHGKRVSANIKDWEWVEGASAWTVRGRLLSYQQRRRG